jgi:O-acetyl-ADP-ribose deacetylase (regulator of RNase III)
MNIKYIIGDATQPQGEGQKIIVHCCNDEQKWGSGFVIAISKRWAQPEKVYRSTPVKDLRLGDVQFVPVEKDIVVANMIGQHGIKPGFITYPNAVVPIQPIRYDAIKKALIKVNEHAIELNATIHGPRFGAGLAGGNWSEIEKIIKEVVTVDVIIYDLK